MNYFCQFCLCFSPFPDKLLLLCDWRKKSFGISVGKVEIARNKQFLLFPLGSQPIQRTSTIFVKFKIVAYKLFQFWRV